MRLLQINDTEYVNPDMIIVISDNDSDDSCWIRIQGDNCARFCDRFNSLQLMSLICEGTYYGNNGIRKEDK